MGKHQMRRLDRRAAERLLGGARADVPDALAGLLAAAAAPPRDDELAGEQAAATAFRLPADHGTLPRPRSSWMIRPALATSRPMRMAVAVTAICVASGVAAVAATGHLAMPGGGSPVPASSPTSASATNNPTTTIGPTSVRGVPATERGATERGATQTDGGPAPSLTGLCHAYLAGAGAEHGKAVQNPAFTALVTAAGGSSHVDAFCTGLLARPQNGPTKATGSAKASTTRGKSAAAHKAKAGHTTGSPVTHPTH